eukprot:c11203_g1_i1 orf=68-295(-)
MIVREREANTFAQGVRTLPRSYNYCTHFFAALIAVRFYHLSLTTQKSTFAYATPVYTVLCCYNGPNQYDIHGQTM